jgi:hypothetical protein
VFGPLYRSGASSSFDFSRYSYLFTESELLAAGIAPNAVIRGIAWNKTSNTVTTGNATFQVYMENVMSLGLGTTSWTLATTGATQVYSNTGQSFLPTTGWQYFAFPTPFAYTGTDLQISTHWDISGVSGNPSNGALNWSFESHPGKAIGVAGSSLASIANLSTINYGNNRPDIRIIFTPPAVDMGVTAIVSPRSDCDLDTAEVVRVQVRNFGSNTYANPPIELIVDGVSQGTENFPNVLGPLSNATYTFSNLKADLSAPGRHVIQVVVSVPSDANAANDTVTQVVHSYFPSANFDQGLPIDWINDPLDKGKDWLFSSSAAFGPAEDHTGGGEFAWVDNNAPHADTINLISTCIDISMMSQPILEFWLYSEEQNNTTLLFVEVESGGNWQQVLGPLGWQGSDWKKIQTCLTITDPQTRVRFRAQEVGTGTRSDIAIDDFRIYDAPMDDVGLVKVISPGGLGCFYGASESFTLAFSNFALNTGADVPVSYQVDGGAIVLDTLKGNFTRCSYDTLSLPSTLDLSAPGLKEINIWIDMAGDDFQSNDSLTWIGGNYPVSLSIDPGYEATYCEGDSVAMPAASVGGGIFRGPGMMDSLTGLVDLGALVPGQNYSYAYQYFPGSFYDVSPHSFGPIPLQNPDTLPLTDDDAIEVEMGFNFVFFDQIYQAVTINANGYVGFGRNELVNAAVTIPQGTAPNNFIAFAMADLNPGSPSSGGDILTETQGTAPNRQFIIHYDSVVHFGGQGFVDGQIILYEGSHIIEMQVALIQPGAVTALMTQGIESQGGILGYTSRNGVNNQVFTMQSEAYRYIPTPCPITVGDTFRLIADPIVDLGPDTLVCDGSDILLDAGIYSSYLWNDGSMNRTLNASQSGTYLVIVTDSDGCTGTDSLQFEQPEPIGWTLLGKGDVPCPSDSLGYIFAMTTGGTPPFRYLWNNGDTTASLQMLPPGSYSQTITDANNCELATSTVDIIALDSLPNAGFSFALSGGLATFNNQSINGNLFAWNFGDGSPVVLADSASHTYQSNGMYQVMLIAYNDCGSDTIIQTIDMTTVGLESYFQQHIQVYPNPTKGSLHLKLGEINLQDAMLEVIDLQGKKVFGKDMGQMKEGEIYSIDLPLSAKGMYILHLSSQQGKLKQKLIIK